MFANVVLNRTKGEEIKLTDDEPDDIDNGGDDAMPDGDDDGSVIYLTGSVSSWDLKCWTHLEKCSQQRTHQNNHISHFISFFKC